MSGSTGLGYAPAVLVPAVLAALVLAGAASPAGGPRCSGSRATWRELETAHFVLSTDLEPDEADDLAEQLEVLLGAIRRGLFDAAPELPARLPVVAFARVEDFRVLAPKPYEGFFARSASGHAAVVLRGDFGRVTRAGIVAHELTHAVLALIVPRAPLWLAEGLATYMEAAGEGEDGETVRIGAPPPHRLAAARRDRAPLAGVLAATGQLGAGQYATSWLLVHYLLAQHRERFLAYEGRLARGGDPAAAWRETFPEWDPAIAASVARLDAALLRYVRDDGRYVETRFPARGEGAHRVTELTPAEADALCRGLAELPGPGQPSR